MGRLVRRCEVRRWGVLVLGVMVHEPDNVGG